MVKIRYMDLPAGLHVSAEKHGRTTVIYLLPGLTAEQRRAAIVRARSSGRMGLGPELPPVALALAIGADRVRMTLRNGLAATRSHPVVLLPALILCVSSAIVFMVVSLVTVVPSQTGRSFSQLFGGPPPVSRMNGRHPPEGAGRDPAAGRRSTSPAPAVPSPISTLPSSVMPPPVPSSPIPVLSPAPSPSPSPSPSPPSPSPSPSPASSPGPAATCVKLGPLGLCVSI